ncbi:Crp/Fnr family transcriptional regulator [Aestuariivirga sp.]|uniref:Crp/Fnr family transcriptional regulator n=1 Tax=Aestuariivirga sp. TaxID=2650926 RepID=UPI00359346F3
MNNPTHKQLQLAPLDATGWLSEQPEDFKNWAARVGRWQHYRAGQFVYMAGDAADGVYGLASGGLEITFPLVGGEPVVIYRAEPGFWVGEQAGFSASPRTISLMAAVESRILHLPSRALEALVAEQPKHLLSFYKLCAINLTNAITLLSETLALTVRARVCRRLLKLTEGRSEADLTQDDLAKLLGVARATLRPCLNDLTAQGAIELGYRKIRVLNPALLALYKDEQ